MADKEGPYHVPDRRHMLLLTACRWRLLSQTTITEISGSDSRDVVLYHLQDFLYASRSRPGTKEHIIDSLPSSACCLQSHVFSLMAQIDMLPQGHGKGMQGQQTTILDIRFHVKNIMTTYPLDLWISVPVPPSHSLRNYIIAPYHSWSQWAQLSYGRASVMWKNNIFKPCTPQNSSNILHFRQRKVCSPNTFSFSLWKSTHVFSWV